MTPATLDEGAALLAAATPNGDIESAWAAIRWLNDNAADLIASARQAQDNAKDAERLDWLDRDDIALTFHCDESGPYVLIENREGETLACNGDIRSAIDAAIAAATPGKP